jgi:ABC-type tungstate transport system substrate-binding protein
MPVWQMISTLVSALFVAISFTVMGCYEYLKTESLDYQAFILAAGIIAWPLFILYVAGTVRAIRERCRETTSMADVKRRYWSIGKTVTHLIVDLWSIYSAIVFLLVYFEGRSPH